MIRKNVTFTGDVNALGTFNFADSVNTPLPQQKSIDLSPPAPPPPEIKKKSETKPAESVNKKFERHTIVELKVDDDMQPFNSIVKQRSNINPVRDVNVKVNKDSIDFVFIFLKTYDILLKKENNQ